MIGCPRPLAKEKADAILKLHRQGAEKYTVSDLGSILHLANLSPEYNVSILQRSHLEWLLSLAWRLSDGFTTDRRTLEPQLVR